jgi:hypothetical protein
MNPNYRALQQAVRELGGTILSSRTAGKHFLVSVRTPQGRTIRVTLSKAPMRDGYVRFWIRQKFQRSKQKGRVKT